MKKIILTLITIFTISLGYSQESKFYLGVGLGFATAGGDVADEMDLKTGLNINILNTGYRFNETWGVTVNLSSSGHKINDYDLAVGVGAFSFGPMYSVSLGSLSWDIKPQYSILGGVIRGDDAAAIGLEDVEFSGNGFVFANSLVFGNGSKGFSFSVDLDFLTGKFTEISYPGGSEKTDEDNSLANFKLGAGVRYNF